MPVITLSNGIQLDTDTGQVVGQGEPQKLTPSEAQKPTVDIPAESVGQGAVDALKQLSVGFNTALFALPDAVIRQVGQALNVRKEELPTFTQFFNRGEAAPKNAVERFANAIGQGMGGTIPFTGVLGAVARTKALTAPITPGSGIAKTLAKETLDFIRTNPGKAVSLDLAFGGAYGAAEQSVEEFVTPGEYKDVLKATVPITATVALPVAGAKLLGLASTFAKVSPTVRAARAVPEMFGTETAQGYAQQVAKESMPNVPVVGGPLRWLGTRYAESAEKKVTEALGPLFAEPGKAPPGVAEARLVTQAIEQDPRLANMFLFTAGEQTLYAPLITAQSQLVKQLSGKELSLEQARYGSNIDAFRTAFELFAPKAKMPVDEALRLTYAQAVKTLDDAAKRVATTTDDEAARIADAFVPQNLDELGDNLRRSILGQMESQFFKLRKQAQEAGMRTGFDEQGVRIPVREAGEPIIPAVDFKKFADQFTRRFKLKPQEERFFVEGMPEPGKLVERELSRLQSSIDAKYEELLPQLIGQKVKADPFVSRLAPEDQDLVVRSISERILSGRGPGAARPRVPRAEDLVLSGIKGPSDAEINAIKSQARKMAEEQVDFSITQPEALDLLESALKFRNQSILRSNKEMDLGNPRRNAQAILDRGNAVLRDVEDFVFKSFNKNPDAKAFIDNYKEVYSQGYEKLFPLMITKRAPGGEFYVSNEKVISNALSSAENVRNLNAIFGDSQEYVDTMAKVMMDKANRAGVVKDGVLNVPAYERFLANNRNVIEAMPQRVQDTLRDELKFGREFSTRLKEMEDRVQLLKDDDLFTVLKKSVRPDADPRQLIEQSIADPATMRKLVNTVGSDPERMEALRRQVWMNVKENILDQTNPGYLAGFIERNGKSLNILYSPEQLKDLRTIAEIQRRVFVAEKPTGTLSAFQTLDEQLRKQVGAGIGTIESTARAATIRQISPFHAGVSLLTRFLGRQQTSIYEAIIYKALTDPEYAHQLARANMPLNSKEGYKQAEKLVSKAGGFLPDLLRNAPKVASIEASQAAMEEEPRPLPRPAFTQGMAPARPVPRMPAAATPAPGPSIPQSPAAQAIPPGPAPRPTFGQQYEALFPRDVIAPLVTQRSQQTPQ